MERIKDSIHLYKAKHYIMPFLAHALGTLAGGFVVTKIAVNHQLKLAMALAILFLFGGISMVLQLPSPLWFSTLDLVLAYLPMAYLVYKLGNKKYI